MLCIQHHVQSIVALSSVLHAPINVGGGLLSLPRANRLVAFEPVITSTETPCFCIHPHPILAMQPFSGFYVFLSQLVLYLDGRSTSTTSLGRISPSNADSAVYQFYSLCATAIATMSKSYMAPFLTYISACPPQPTSKSLAPPHTPLCYRGTTHI